MICEGVFVPKYDVGAEYEHEHEDVDRDDGDDGR